MIDIIKKQINLASEEEWVKIKENNQNWINQHFEKPEWCGYKDAIYKCCYDNIKKGLFGCTKLMVEKIIKKKMDCKGCGYFIERRKKRK